MYKRILLEALRRIRDEGAPIRYLGICSNVRELTDNDDLSDEAIEHWIMTSKLLKGLLHKWPLKLKGTEYLVEGFEAYERSSEDGTIWQNPRRLELLNWLIVQLENE